MREVCQQLLTINHVKVFDVELNLTINFAIQRHTGGGIGSNNS